MAINFDSDEYTLNACKAVDAEIVHLPFQRDFSEIRNAVINQNGMNLYIEPWEILASGHEHIINLTKGRYFCQVIQEEMITKETRLWSGDTGLKFSNPVYESLPVEGSVFLPQMVIYSQKNTAKRDLKLTRELINEWKSKSGVAAAESMYYSAYEYLINKQYDEFIQEANRCIFYASPSRMTTMTKYYMSAVIFHLKKDYPSAISYITQCIFENPKMAEFWCLLGDIHCNRHLYDKAQAFFTNAIILGKQRSKDDFWPIDVSKYKKYPEIMIAGCSKILKKSKIYGAKT